MFPRRFWAGRYFAPRYWPQSQGIETEKKIICAGIDLSPRISASHDLEPRITSTTDIVNC